MEMKRITNNTKRRKNTRFGFFRKKFRNFETGSGPRCCLPTTKSKQEKFPAENKTFEESKMAAKKPEKIEDEDSDVEFLFGNRTLFEMSATESAESESDDEYETEEIEIIEAEAASPAGNPQACSPVSTRTRSARAIGREAPPAPSRLHRTTSRPTTSRLLARDLTLDLNLVQPCKGPGPKPNKFRFNQRPDPERDVVEIEEAEAIQTIETEEAHYIITEPEPAPYVSPQYYTLGPTYNSFNRESEADTESTVDLCSNPDCTEHGDEVDTESIITESSGCDNPHCPEHGACPETKTEAEEDEEDEEIERELLQQGAVKIPTGWQCHDCNESINNNEIPKAILEEIEKKIEEAAEPEEEEGGEEKEAKTAKEAHAALMDALDNVVDSLANNNATQEMVELAQELCGLVDSIANPTVSGVKMIVTPGPETGATAKQRPFGASSDEIKPLRVRVHKVGVWVKQQIKKQNIQKGEAEANIREIEKEIEKATEAMRSRFSWTKEKDDQIFRSEINTNLREALVNLCQCNQDFYNLFGQPQKPWPHHLSREELRKTYRLGYNLAMEKHSNLIASEGLRVPSVYDSEVELEEEEEKQRAPKMKTPYPIKLRWELDQDGNMRLSGVTTSIPNQEGKKVNEADARAKLTRDIPEGAASAAVAPDDDEVDEEIEVAQDEQERLFSAIRGVEGTPDPLREFFNSRECWTQLRPGAPHIFCPETEAENYELSEQADLAERYNDGIQNPPAEVNQDPPDNRFPRRWRQIKRIRRRTKF